MTGETEPAPSAIPPDARPAATASAHTGVTADNGERSLGRDVGTVSLLTLASRILGLVRDLITVRIFGDTLVGSAFAAAFAIPNMFRRLFGEGALSAAFLPAYTRLHANDPERGDAFATVVLLSLAAVTGAITVIAELVILTLLVLPAGDDPARRLSLELIAITLPFMPLICSAAILGGMLQVHGRFALWAAASIILNLCIIATAVPYYFIESTPEAWARVISGAVVVSGVLQVAWSLRALGPYFRWRSGFARVWPEARSMLSKMLPALIGLGTLQLNSFADTVIAMWPNLVGPTVFGVRVPMDEASNSILYFAQRLYQFPLGVFGLAVASAVFPRLSRAAHDHNAFAQTIRQGLRLSLFIVAPATVGIVLVAPHLVRTLFTGGPSGESGFSDDGVRRASLALAAYGTAIWAYSVNHLWTRACYAKGDTVTPMRLALWMVGLNIVLNAIVIWPLGEAGLAVSTAVCAMLQCVLLGRACARDAHAPIVDRPTLRAILRIAITAAIMGAALGLTTLLWPHPETPTWSDAAIRLGVLVTLGIIVYGGLALLTRSPELGWLRRGAIRPIPNEK